MSKSINCYICSGNLGRDAELSYTPNSKAVAKFSVAVSTGYGDNEKTMWVNCVLFDKMAESLSPYLLKGSKVTVQGRLQSRQWDDAKTGTKREAWEVVATDIALSGGNGQASVAPKAASPARAPRQSRQTPAVPVEQNVAEEDLDGVPF